MHPALSFDSGRLGQHRTGELPCLGHREACPTASFAVAALSQVDEHPCGRAQGIAESESADCEFPTAARTQAIVPSVSAAARDWIWPHIRTS